MENRNAKAWLYLLPALLFLGVFMIYPLVDVVVYSLEENYESVREVYTGVGLESAFCSFPGRCCAGWW